MTRSIFEHCSPIWNPKCESICLKFESLQKRAIKWVFNEEYHSYSPILYFTRCKQLKILPLQSKLHLNDLVFLHKIINGGSPVILPDYLTFYDETNSNIRRLRSSHLDRLSLVSSIKPEIKHSYSKNSSGGSEYKVFENSFFYRSHLLWNRLPLAIRETISPPIFKKRVINYLWQDSFQNVIAQYENLSTSDLAYNMRNSLVSPDIPLDNHISVDAE